MSEKPILVLDFDGMLHSYKSGWQGADVIPDLPVDGAQEFIIAAQKHFKVVIHSSRCCQLGGMDAIVGWLMTHNFPDGIGISDVKPPVHITLDDRGWLFTGKWPDMDELLDFKPWYK